MSKEESLFKIKQIMKEQDISIDDIHNKVDAGTTKSMNILLWFGITVIIASGTYISINIKIHSFKYFIALALSLAAIYSALYLHNNKNLNKYFPSFNLLAFILFIIGSNVFYSEYALGLNSLYLSIILSVLLLIQQYNLFKLQDNEPSIWIILFLSGCLSINLLSSMVNTEFLLFAIASLITMGLTHVLSKKYYIRTTPALYAISSIVFGISAATYLVVELKPATEVIMIVPVILFAISHYIKSKTILFVACASSFYSILVIFRGRLIDSTNTLLITCGTLLIGIVILILGMKANKREQDEILHSNKTGK